MISDPILLTTDFTSELKLVYPNPKKLFFYNDTNPKCIHIGVVSFPNTEPKPTWYHWLIEIYRAPFVNYNTSYNNYYYPKERFFDYIKVLIPITLNGFSSIQNGLNFTETAVSNAGRSD